MPPRGVFVLVYGIAEKDEERKKWRLNPCFVLLVQRDKLEQGNG